MAQACHSRSQLYRWMAGHDLERRERERKKLPEETVENAVKVIAMLPHMGGRKGQLYMLYHKLGLIGMEAYDHLKANVKRLLGQEVVRRRLLPESSPCYEHVRPERVGQIWAEDFTEVAVEGHTFKVAVLLDTFDQYYLGWVADSRASASLAAQPVNQALAKTRGRGPEMFLRSDNGSQYISAKHDKLLTSAEIVQRCIPACVPQYNGTVDGGMRESKSVLYNVWERRTRENADEEKPLLGRLQSAIDEAFALLNEKIPRPALGGVTPADVHNGRKEAKQNEITEYRQTEEARRDVPPWKRNSWETLRSGLQADAMSDDELLTKLAFSGRRPLRRIAKRNRQCVG